MASNPLAEVFGFPISNVSVEIIEHRRKKICPFNNIEPTCTKNSRTNPLGVCGVIANNANVITCPVRFREDWIFREDAASFFFPKDSKTVLLKEIALKDVNGKELGNCDYILARVDEFYNIVDFGSIEVQSVYISGNVTKPFDAYMMNQGKDFTWADKGYPTPDWLSSSLKRLVPQITMKGRIFYEWKKKQAIVLQSSFFETLSKIEECSESDAEIIWLLYDLFYDETIGRNKLKLVRKVFTKFEATIEKLGKPVPGEIGNFVKVLENNLRKKGRK